MTNRHKNDVVTKKSNYLLTPLPARQGFVSALDGCGPGSDNIYNPDPIFKINPDTYPISKINPDPYPISR